MDGITNEAVHLNLCVHVCLFQRKCIQIQTHIHIHKLEQCLGTQRSIYIHFMPSSQTPSKVRIDISHFLLKNKTEAQGNFVINNNITKKLKFIVDF